MVSTVRIRVPPLIKSCKWRKNMEPKWCCLHSLTIACQQPDREKASSRAAVAESAASVASVAVGCEDLPIGVVSDEADALPKRRQAVQDLGGHWTSDHVPTNHYEIRIDALEVF